MLSVEQAIARLLADAPGPPASEPVPLAAARGRVLAVPLVATVDVPPADNSAMDGYALAAADWRGADQPLPLGGRVAAGQVGGDHTPHTVTRIFTGAELPNGADAVAMQENCRVDDDGVRVLKQPVAGDHVRARGQDTARGANVLPAGRRLLAQDIGVAASVGCAALPVRRRLRVAVVANGDELVEPGAEAGPGKIFNSNRYLLGALLGQWGFDVVDMGVAPDRPEVIAERFSHAADQADVVLSCGGVSVGEEDHVKAVLETIGQLSLWRIAMKPGKPLAYGRIGETPFLGLPGNPASALVTAMIIARPFLAACQGALPAETAPLMVDAAFTAPAPDRQCYLRVRHTGRGLEAYTNQSSGILLGASWADGLAIQPPGLAIEPGTPLQFLPWALLA
ncbi:molybdopterin molybdotransferase MoeA [Marinihelvus fidelis]|uniref:Molybdopterin molybdenumtransferase n=1 Tax=Marinihelvus fidelis TaxID=2613842 RepID=A0A5N0TBW0_9GAMM|nr:gephyrin-like molybdotransferase Glp [Marinihelvus fidelis]KAA9132515.1 molybdopterin molybdotransferase MoeA [Marinihelvus fidelis]